MMNVGMGVRNQMVAKMTICGIILRVIVSVKLTNTQMLKIAHTKMPILFIVLKCENEILNATEASIDDFS